MPTTWSYAHPTRVFWGEPWLDQLTELIEPLAPGPMMILTGRNAAKACGYLEELTRRLPDDSWHVFDRIEPEPSHSTVMAAVEFVEAHKAKTVLALGGGSAIDAAKAVACLAYTGAADVTPYMDRETSFTAKGLPVVALPTTAGTGSEVTPFSVLTNDVTGEKKSLPSPFFYPDIAIINPRYLTTVPTKVIGDVGLDALAHAYEALWSVNANPVSDALSFRAIKLITEYLLTYYKDPTSIEAASAVGEGSTIAGMAFSNTLTAGCHALSYPIGKLFGLSHGASCAMTLHLVARVNSSAVQAKFIELAAYLGLASVEEVLQSIEHLRQQVTTIPTLRDLGAQSSDLQSIAVGAFQPLLRNNPVELTETRIVEMLTPEIV